MRLLRLKQIRNLEDEAVSFSKKWKEYKLIRISLFS